MYWMWRSCVVSMTLVVLVVLTACNAINPSPSAKEATPTPVPTVSDAARQFDEMNNLVQANVDALKTIHSWRETHEQTVMGQHNDYVAEFLLPDRGRSKPKDGDWTTISIGTKRFEKQQDGTFRSVDVDYKLSDFVPRLLMRTGFSRTGDKMQTVVSGQEKIGNTTYKVAVSQFSDVVQGIDPDQPETRGVVSEKSWVDTSTNLIFKREWKFVGDDNVEKYNETTTFEYDIPLEIEAPPM